MKTLTTQEVRGMADLVNAYKTMQVPEGQEMISKASAQVGASLYARDFALPIAVERDTLAANLRRFEEREAHWSAVLGVTDGGQYRADWDARIRALVAERDALRTDLDSALGAGDALRDCLEEVRVERDALAAEVTRLRQAFLAKSVRLLAAEQSAAPLTDHRSTCEEAARVADAEAERCRKIVSTGVNTLVFRTRAEACELVAEKIRALPTPMRAFDVLDALRRDGWTVAVHNDYRLNDKPHTFWLLTKGERAVKGEGETDAQALGQIAQRLAEEAGRG